ncbi:MAG: 1-acyl-sn-glycerol-3-phosphate acyltransferase [Polyangia bacterium]
MGTSKKPKVVVSWWLALLEALVVHHVKVDGEWIERVRAAAQRGPIVFVLRNRSLVDFLCIRGLTRKHGLPPLGFVSGLSTFLFMPLWLWLLRLFRRRPPERRRRKLRDTFAAGGSALVFLRRPTADKLGSRPVAVDGIRLTAEVQGELSLPVQVLPTVFLWGEDPMLRAPGGLAFVFGTNDYPRLLRSLWMLLRRRSLHGAYVSEPVDISELREQRGVGDEALPGVLRAWVGRHIEKIRRERLGSLTKPSSRIKAEVLESRRLRAELEAVASDQGIPPAEIEPRARAIVQKMATDFSPRLLGLFASLMSFVFKNLYTGIEIPPGDLEALRVASGRGPVLILPSHKSHVDYLVISQAMRRANIMLPHIAAGDNLSFWPLGWLFRSSGAFFIRRRFVNDRFYSAVVNAYVRRLIQEGYSIEVFIEGGRSRTGKLLRPKLGMIEMALRAAAYTPRRDPGVLPTSIGYERVVEESSYVDESVGRPKKKENVAGLIRTTRVLFHRYGRLYVRTGRFFTLQEVLDELGIERSELLQRGQALRTAALEVAMRTLREIQRITVATPSSILATALLGLDSAPISHDELRRLAIELTNFLRAHDAILGALVEKWPRDPGVHEPGDALDSTIEAFVQGGRLSVETGNAEPRYSVRAGQRIPLDYYKNNIVHFFVPASLVCCSVRESSPTIERSTLIDEVTLACRLWRWEMLLPAAGRDGAPTPEVEKLVETGIEDLVRSGIATRKGDRVTIADRGRAAFHRDTLRGCFEVYLVVLQTLRARALGELDGDPQRHARQRCEQLVAEGRHRHPEAVTRIQLQGAFQALKDLRLLRPAAGERPFDEGGLGERLLTYLERALSPPTR